MRGLVSLALLFVGANALATANSGISYHGRILKADGTPLQGNSVQFQLTIRSPGNENCLLYQELQTLDMANSNGVFSITINDGSGTRVDTTGITFNNVFSNRSALAGSGCNGTTNYVPNAADGRAFVVAFRDENMSTFETLPTQTIAFSPAAIQALNVAGYAPGNLLKFDDSVLVANASPLNNTQYGNLIALINGTSNQYLKTGSNGTGVLPSTSTAPTSPTAGEIWFDSTTNTVKYFNGTSTQALGSGSGTGTVTSIIAGTGLTGGTITSSGTIALGTVGTAGAYYKVNTDAYGRVTSGAAALVEADIPTLTTAGHVAGSAISGTIGGSTIVNTTGAITTTGVITGGSVTANSVSGQSLLVYNSGNTHKTTISAPTLSNDYSFIFPDSAGASGNMLVTDGAGHLSWVSAGGAPSGAAGGDLSGTYPNPSVVALRGKAISTTLPTAAGQVLKYDGTTTYAPGFINGADIRSSLTGSAAFFPTTACTASQTLAYSSVTDTLACATISAAALTGVLPVANGGTGTATGSITGTGALTFAAGGTNQNVVLQPSGTGAAVLNGSVGVGTASPATKLQVAGSLTLGDGGETCGAGFAGAVRYNSTTIQYCNATSWITLASTSGTISSLTGDVTSTGSGAVPTVVGKVNGVSYGASPATNTVPVVTSANTVTYEAVPNAALANSSVTLGTTNVALGATAPSLTGLASVGVGSTSNIVSVAAPSVSGPYNFNLPATAGTSGYALTSGGGAAAPMTWTQILPLTGASSITQLGTVTTGTWNATTIGVPYGGTGVATLSPHGVVIGEGTASVATAVGSAGTLLQGSALDPAFTTTAVLGNGTTAGSLSLTNTAGGYVNIKPNAASAVTWNMILPANGGTNGYVLTTDGTGTTSWLAAAGSGTVNAGTTNQLAYYQSNGAIVSGLTSTANSVLLTDGSNALTWQPKASDNFTQYALLAGRAGGQSLSGGTAASNNLTLDSTTNATKGSVLLAPSGGNVGVGTTSPADPLAVVSSVNGQIGSFTSSTGAASFAVSAQPANTASVLLRKSIANGARWQLQANSTTESGSNAGSDFQIVASTDSGTALSPYLFINRATGNVGIGTTSPASPLTVNGLIQSTTGGIKFPDGTTQTTASTGGSIAGLTATKIPKAGSATTLIDSAITDASGSIGIGTTSPAYTLDVVGTIHGSSAISANGAVLAGTGSGNAPSHSFSPYSGAGMWYPGSNSLAFSAGAAERLRIDSSGNVGVGTTSPGASLDVVNNTSPTIRVTNVSGTAYPEFVVQNYGPGTPFIQLQSAQGTQSSTTATAVGNSLGILAFQGYNGTGWALDTNGVSNAAVKAVAEAAFTGTSYPTQLQFFTTPSGSQASAQRMIILANGNVGVGTTSPQALLDIAGPLRVAPAALPGSPVAGQIAIDSGASNALKFYNGSAWQTVGTSTGNGTVNTGTLNALAYYNAAGNAVSSLTTANNSVLLTNGSGVPAWTTIATDSFTQYALLAGRAGGQSLKGGAAASENLTLDSTANGTKGFVLLAPSGGNVGVGTTSPTSNLQVTATAAPAMTLTAPSQGTFWTMGGASSAGQYSNVAVSNDAVLVGGASGGNAIVTNQVGGKLIFATGTTSSNDSAKMTILSGGNVGIGTTSPASPLTVAGIIQSTTGGIKFPDGTTQTTAASAPGSASISGLTAATATNSPDSLNFSQTWNWSTATTQNPMTMTANGLTTGSLLSLTSSNTSLNSTSGLLNVANTGTSTTGTVARIQANSTAGSGLYMLANGNVGVGTASPGVPLEVNGIAKVGYVRSTSGSASYPDFSFNSYNQTGMFAPTTNVIGFSTAGTERVRIDTSGNVGIGTTSPTSLLHSSDTAAKTAAYTGVLHAISNTSSTASINKVGMDVESTGSWTGGSNTGLVVNATGGTTNYAATFSGGNVGIGSASPGSPLDVYYDLNVGAGTQSLATFHRRNGNGSGVLLGYAANGTTDLNGVISSTGYSKDLALGATNGSASPVEAMRIQSGGNVGIGTTSPSSTLSVNGVIQSITGGFKFPDGTTQTTAASAPGSASISGLTAATATNSPDSLNFAQTWNWSTATTQNPMTMTANGLTTGSLLSLTSSNASLNSTSGLLNVANTGASTTGTVARLQSNSAAGSGFTVLANGNVGVGTAAPLAALQVARSSGGTITNIYSSTAALTIQDDSGAGNTAVAQILGGGTGTEILGFGSRASVLGAITYGNSNNAMALTTNGSERLRIDSSGNVGIGTTSPSAAIDIQRAGASTSVSIQNTTSSSASYPGLTVVNYDGAHQGGFPVVGLRSSRGSAGAVSANQNGDLLGLFGVYGMGATSWSGLPTSYISVIASGNYTDSSYPSVMAFNTTASGSSSPLERMRIDQSGNIGIGTTSPTSPLTVAGVVQSTTGGFKFPDGTTQTTAAAGGSAAISGLTPATATNSPDSLNFAQTWNWSTATTQNPMTMTANGLTTGSLLSLTSSNASLNSTSGLLNVANTGSSTTGTVARIQSNSTTGSGLSVMANGNVGIGTASPTSRLTIVGPNTGGYPLTIAAAPGTGGGGYMNIALNNQTSGAYKSAVEFQNNGTPKFSFGVDYLGAGVNNFSLFDNVAGATRIMVDPLGNVGIGTTSPSQTLQVTSASAPAMQVGPSTAANDTANIFLSGRQASTTYTSVIGAGQDGSLIYSSTSGNHYFRNGAVAQMTILPSGNVGIGTASPASPLTVAGVIQSTSGGIKFPDGTTQTTAATGGSSLLVAPTTSTLVGGSSGAATNTSNGDLANTVFGYHALNASTTGGANTAVGAYAMGNTTTGGGNEAFGQGTMIANVSGSDNVAIGYNALTGSTNASAVIAIGSYAHGNNGTGSYDEIAIGKNSLFNAAGAGGNVAVGRDTGNSITSGASNVILGYGTAHSTLTTGSNNILIGAGYGVVDTPAASTSNFLDIGNVIFATGMNGTVASPAGNVGIGTNAPSSILELRKDTASAIGPSLTLSNNGGGASSGSSIDFAAPSETQVVQDRIQSLDDGNWSSHLTFLTKTPGASGNALSERMRITSNGNVGIGTTSPAQALDVVGSVRATSFITTSDRRLKTNIETLRSLEAILKLRGVHFNWVKDGSPELGLIAQEVEEVYPELVVTDPVTGLKAVKYSNLVAPLIEATKELEARVRATELENQKLRADLEELRRDVEALKKK